MTPSQYTSSRARTDTETLVQMFPEIRARAFAVQGIADYHKLKRIQEAVAKLPEGGNWNDLRDTIGAEIGGDGEATRKRAETILRTNGFQAYAAARYRKQMANKEVFPYLKYVSMDDGRVRSRHAELDGVILPKDDPFWKDHYPPWDFNCRCIAIELTAEDAQDEQEAGEGVVWNKATRDDWLARYRGMDSARQFHFRPDALEMDLRDLAKAEGRTHEDMETFGRLMQTRKVGTGVFGTDGTEQTTTVREWLWRPIQREYQAKALADTTREHAYVLDAWTGEELGQATGERHSVKMPYISPAEAWRDVIVIHSHPSGSAAVSPRDVLSAAGGRIEAVETVAPSGDWQRVKAHAHSPHMREMLREWVAKFAAAQDDPAATRRLRGEWDRWFKSQQRLGYLQLNKGRMS